MSHNREFVRVFSFVQLIAERCCVSKIEEAYEMMWGIFVLVGWSWMLWSNPFGALELYLCCVGICAFMVIVAWVLSLPIRLLAWFIEMNMGNERRS